MTISQRASVHGVACDVVCTGRFYDFLEKRARIWGVVVRQPIYEKDRLDPIDPAAVLKLRRGQARGLPEGYRHLAYIQQEIGYTVKRDMPGLKGPVVERLYACGRGWLAAAQPGESDLGQVTENRAMNICMVGYGMMGVWHSEALKQTDAVLHTVVGRRPEAAAEFAQRYGYRKWTVSLEEALADPAIDIVIIASPQRSPCRAGDQVARGRQAHLDRDPDRDEPQGPRSAWSPRASAAARSTASATRCGSAASARRCSSARAPARRRSATSPAASSSSAS
jgi:hypothetical protein